MGLISGIMLGMMFGIGIMAGWQHMMRYRSRKRVAKVRISSISVGFHWIIVISTLFVNSLVLSRLNLK